VPSIPGDAPEEFLAAVSRVRAASVRPEVVLTEMPAPSRIAPHAVAIGGDVVLREDELATGRFVLLYDPAGQDAWNGTFRAVTFVRTTLESDLGDDPLLAQVGWTWLEESLDAAGAEHTASGGTVTRVVSESFGALAERPHTVELEVRASWTPLDDIAAHVTAWADLLCTVAGLPPLPHGVSILRRHA
jgi:hypothetical protein